MEMLIFSLVVSFGGLISISDQVSQNISNITTSGKLTETSTAGQNIQNSSDYNSITETLTQWYDNTQDISYNENNESIDLFDSWYNGSYDYDFVTALYGNDSSSTTPPLSVVQPPSGFESPREEWNNVKFNATDELIYQSLLKSFDIIRTKILSNYPSYANADNFTKSPPPKGSTINFENVYLPEVYRGLQVITDVYVSFQIQRIVEMDTSRQGLTVFLLETYLWRDLSLVWNVNDTEIPIAIAQIELSADQIWTPDVFMNNVLDSNQLGNDYAAIQNDGAVYLFRLVQYTLPCTVSIDNFPFDVHNCSLDIGQNINGPARIRYLDRLFSQHLNSEDQYYAHLEWKLKDAKANAFPYVFSVDAEGNKKEWDGYYYSLTVTVEREGLFYAVVLIFPLVLLNLLSFVVFTYNVDSTERLDFAMSLILTYYVLVLIIIGASPPSGSQMPILGLYIILSTCVAVSTFVESLLMILLYEHCLLKKKKMPECFFKVLTFCIDAETYARRKYGDYFLDEVQECNQLGMNKKESADSNCIESKPSAFERFKATADYDGLKWRFSIQLLNYAFCILTLLLHILIPICLYT